MMPNKIIQRRALFLSTLAATCGASLFVPRPAWMSMHAAQAQQVLAPAGTPVFNFEAKSAEPFSGAYKGQEKTTGTDFIGLGWSFNLWDAASTGEGGVEAHPGSGERAVFLRNVSGQPSSQLYPWKGKPVLLDGHRYEAVISYASNGPGVWRLGEPGKPDTVEVALQDSGGQWREARRTWTAKAGGELDWALQNPAPGNTLYVRSIQILDLGGPTAEQVLASGAVPQQPDAYNASILKGLATKKLPRPVFLLGASEEATLKYFHLHGPAADAATMKVVNVAGQPFKKALRIDVNRLPGEFWHTMLQALAPLPVKKGDRLLVTVYARGGVQNLAGSPGLTGVSIKPIPGDPHGFATRELVLTDQWQKIQMPVDVKEDRSAGKLEWISALSAKKQWLEFGGISVLNFGPTVKLADLPDTSKTRSTYAGREANATWRKEALARIEKIRKADLQVLVVDKNGKPVPNAQVKVEMKRHAFRWGTAIVPSIEVEPIPDWNREAHNTAFKHVFNLFNHIAVDIDLKHPFWVKKSEAEKAKVLAGMKMFKDRGMTIHGHTMVWPSFTNMPDLAPLKDDPKKLQAALLEHIREIGQKTAPFTRTWDVVNEPYGNQEITRIVGGTSAMIEWYREARKVLPRGTGLYINEGITPGGGGATEAYYYDVCRELVQKGAPLDGIGLQSHVGGNPTDIAKVWASMNKFAALKPGMRLGITEFDINFRGDQKLEGDFTRDFTILAFSHPAVEMFAMWGFHDPYHWLGYAPIFNKDGSLKPSGQAWMDLVHKTWITKAGGKANAAGKYLTRGFLGDYEITVSHGVQTKTLKSTLPKTGAS
jgi:GH35 family endo-1,4-beta-xylanase